MIATSPTRYRPDFSYYIHDAVIGRSIEKYGEYAQPEVDFLTSMLNSNSIVYDVGGNIGYYARAFASRAQHVYTFEPNPDNYVLLKKNIDDVSNVTAYPCAVGHEFGVCNISTFDLEEENNYGGMVVGYDFQGVDATLVPIDAMNLPAPHLIKIDVEGAEWPVLMGAQRTIKQHTPAIIYEAHETVHFQQIYDLLSPMPYRFYWIGVSNYNPNNFRGNAENVFGQTGLFSVMAWPRKLGTLDLPEVTGRDDNILRFMSN